MIREYCDRCSLPVGQINDGGPPIAKKQAEEILAFIGRKRDYILCPDCSGRLYTLLLNWYERKDR